MQSIATDSQAGLFIVFHVYKVKEKFGILIWIRDQRTTKQETREQLKSGEQARYKQLYLLATFQLFPCFPALLFFDP